MNGVWEYAKSRVEEIDAEDRKECDARELAYRTDLSVLSSVLSLYQGQQGGTYKLSCHHDGDGPPSNRSP